MKFTFSQDLKSADSVGMFLASAGDYIDDIVEDVELKYRTEDDKIPGKITITFELYPSEDEDTVRTVEYRVAWKRRDEAEGWHPVKSEAHGKHFIDRAEFLHPKDEAALDRIEYARVESRACDGWAEVQSPK